ncbi:MAG TPA: PilZ domain-containing protein [Candidatus Angelobacter sp.]|nr:PilZ domain-containing protein [Candidatus Angelobacter sp.]
MDIAKSETPIVANTLKERRRSRRFHCDGKVEINRIPSNGKREGKLIDLSNAGCFIEMAQPFAAPSYVEVMIDTKTTRLRLTGTVKSSRKTGMGIEFGQVGSGAKRLLEDLIVELKQNEDKTAV